MVRGRIADAVQQLLQDMKRRRIDAAFARMAEDATYQAELLQIKQELAPSSDAVWRQLDRTEGSRQGSR
jgi:hypothetical protein